MQKQAIQYRQGDVFLGSIDKLPKGTKVAKKEAGQIVLARGPVTGHAHAIKSENVQLRHLGEGPSMRRFLVAMGAATLKHQEHAAIKLKPAIYEVTIQREYAGGAVANVED